MSQDLYQSLMRDKKEDRLAIITCLFNPADYGTHETNFRYFYEALSYAHEDLFIIEASSSGIFITDGLRNAVHLPFSDDNVMWQKERMLNILISQLPGEYTNIAWIDADIIFDDSSWIDKANTALREFNLVQLFENSDITNERLEVEYTREGVASYVYTQGGVDSALANDFFNSHPGYAWAIRRNCLVNLLHDTNIVGGGDSVMVLSAYGVFEESLPYRLMSNSHRDLALIWSIDFYNKIQGSVGFIRSRVKHLYHGSQSNRNYIGRNYILKECGYSPRDDVRIDDNGLFKWISTKNDMVCRVRDYFMGRKEDSGIHPSIDDCFDLILCINLDEDRERYANLIGNLLESKYRVERVRAIDGSTRRVVSIFNWLKANKGVYEDIKELKSLSGIGVIENEYALANLLSHRKAIKRARYKGARKILILEDDVLPHKNIEIMTAQIKSRDWDIFWLGYSQYDWREVNLNDGVFYAKKTKGSFSYALDESHYDIILRKTSELELSYDNALGGIADGTGNGVYIVAHPPLFIADVRSSRIRCGTNQYKHSLMMCWNPYDYKGCDMSSDLDIQNYPDLKEALMLAEKKSSNGYLYSALEEYANISHSIMTNPWPIVGMAQATFKYAQYIRSLFYWDLAIDNANRHDYRINEWWLYGRAIAKLKLGDNIGAQRDLGVAYGTNPNNQSICLTYCQALVMCGQHELAWQVAQKAWSHSLYLSENAAAIRCILSLLLSKSDPVVVQSWINRINDAPWLTPDVNKAIGDFLYQRRSYNYAIDYYTRALTSTDFYLKQDCQVKIALCHLGMGNISKIIALQSNFSETALITTHLTRLRIGLLRLKGEHDKVINEASNLLTTTQERSNYSAIILDSLISIGRFSDICSIIDMDMENESATNLRMYAALLHQGKTEQARNLLDNLLQREPGNKGYLMTSLRHMLRTGRFSKAAVFRRSNGLYDLTSEIIILCGLHSPHDVISYIEIKYIKALEAPAFIVRDFLYHIINVFLLSPAVGLTRPLRKYLYDIIETTYRLRAIDIERDTESLAMIAECFVRSHEYESALEAISKLPGGAYGNMRLGHLNTWALAREGRHDSAKFEYSMYIKSNYIHQLHGTIIDLRLDEHCKLHAPLDSGVIAITPIKDERPSLPHFLKHHRSIGVKTFIFIDNGSTDGSYQYLVNQEDVILFHSKDSFSESAQSVLWLNYMLNNYGHDRWCLFLDADEEFIYPEWESLSIDEHCTDLDREGAEIYSSFMLDVYPKSLNKDFKEYDHLRQMSTLYDANHGFYGDIQYPHTYVTGGVRERLFGVTSTLSKAPLIRGGSVLYTTNHNTTPGKISSGRGLLLHYKLIDMWCNPSQEPDQDGRYVSRGASCIGRYNTYHSGLRGKDHIELFCPDSSREKINTVALSEIGFFIPIAHDQKRNESPLNAIDADTPIINRI